VDAILEQYRALAKSTGSVLMLGSDPGITWGGGSPAELSRVAHARAAQCHAENGIYLLWGHGIAPTAGHTGHGSVQQLCATLLALLGLPPDSHAQGPPLTGTAGAH